MTSLRFVCYIEEDEDRFIGYCVNLKGVFAEGTTTTQTKENLREAINIHLETMLRNNIPIPQETFAKSKPGQQASPVKERIEYQETGEIRFAFA